MITYLYWRYIWDHEDIISIASRNRIPDGIREIRTDLKHYKLLRPLQLLTTKYKRKQVKDAHTTDNIYCLNATDYQIIESYTHRLYKCTKNTNTNFAHSITGSTWNFALLRRDKNPDIRNLL